MPEWIGEGRVVAGNLSHRRAAPATSLDRGMRGGNGRPGRRGAGTLPGRRCGRDQEGVKRFLALLGMTEYRGSWRALGVRKGAGVGADMGAVDLSFRAEAELERRI